MPNNEEILQAMTRLSILETQVAAIDGRLRNLEMSAAATGAGLQNIQGAMSTVVADLISSRDKFTDKLFAAVDVTPKTVETKTALGITTTDTAMK